MTIEEKAKAYDEALEKAKKRYEYAKKEGNPIWCSYEELFPQLAESEDEKIRKSIIHLLQVGGYMSQEDKTKAFAWLEKQKEQKPTREYSLLKIANVVRKALQEHDRLVNRLADNVARIGPTVEPGEEQIEWGEDEKTPKFNVGEYIKFRGDIYEITKINKYPNGVYNYDVKIIIINPSTDPDEIVTNIGMLAEQNMFKVEQKQIEWSEEDEDILNNIVAELEALKRRIGECCFPAYDRLINWLKFIRFRLHWEPSEEQIEWSEKDEHMKDTLEYEMRSSYFSPNLIHWTLSHLQPHWKPSVEQMEALNESSVSWMNERMGNCELLKSLYNDLKNL